MERSNRPKKRRGISRVALAVCLVVSLSPLASLSLAFGENNTDTLAPGEAGQSNGLAEGLQTGTAGDEAFDVEGTPVNPDSVEGPMTDDPSATAGNTDGSPLAAVPPMAQDEGGISILAADITSWVQNLDFSLTRANGEVPSVDQGTDPTDYAIGLPHYVSYSAAITFNIQAPVGEELHAGDAIMLPFLQTGWSFVNTGAENLYDPTGLVILGTWRIENCQLKITLSGAVEGQTSLSNCSIITAPNIKVSFLRAIDTVQDVIIGTKTHQYKANKLERTPSIGDHAKLGVGGNSRASWTLTTWNVFSNELTTSRGTAVSKIESYYMEDRIPASEGVQNVSVPAINATVPYIVSETDWRTAALTGNNISMASVKSLFTLVVQNPGESYEDFKSRLQQLQYGIFKEDDGGFVMVFNFGNLTDPNYPIKYQNLWPDLYATCVAQEGVTPAEAQIIVDSLGAGNVIGGNVVQFYLNVTTDYNQALVDTQKTNTLVGSYVKDGVQKEARSVAQVTLQAGQAVGKPSAGQVTIAKADATSGLGLENAIFKIQHSTDGGTTWSDTAYPTLTTGTDGTATSGNLSPGLYRLVEVTAAPGYDASTATYTPQTFTVSVGDTEGVVVTATNQSKNYTVHYDTNGGTPVTIDDKTGVKWWQAGLLPVSEPTKPGSVFTGWTLSDGGSVGTHNGQAVAAASKYSDLADDDSTMEITLQAQWLATADVSVDPPVRKVITGDTPPTPETFTFKLTAANSANPMPAGSVNGEKTATVVGEGTTDFGEWTYTATGTYEYAITEVNSGVAGYAYDPLVYTITDVVTDNAGQLEVARTIFDGASNVSEVVFTNNYTILAAGEGLTAIKTVDKTSAKPGDSLTYTITLTNNGSQMLQGIVIRDYMPAYTSYVSSDNGGYYGKVNGKNHVTWWIASLAPGASVALSMVVKIDDSIAPGTNVQNVALQEATGGLPGDPNDPVDPGTPTNQVTTTVSQPAPTSASAPKTGDGLLLAFFGTIGLALASAAVLVWAKRRGKKA